MTHVIIAPTNQPELPSRRVQMPGELGPPPVAVAFDVPADWQVRNALGHSALLVEPDPPADRIATTVHLSTTRSEGTSVSFLAAGAHETFLQYAEAVEIADERVVVIDDLPGLVREYLIAIPQRVARPVVQFGLYLVVQHAGTHVVDAVEFHITGDADRRDGVVAVLDGVLGSLGLGRDRDGG